MQLPAVFCALVIRGAWQVLVLNSKKLVKPLAVDIRFNPREEDEDTATESVPPPLAEEPGNNVVDAGRIEVLSSALRTWAPVLLKAGVADQGSDTAFSKSFLIGIASWLDSVAKSLRCGATTTVVSRGKLNYTFDAVFLIRCVILSDSLTDDRNLADVVDQTMEAFLPGPLAAWWEAHRHDKRECKVPSAPVLSKCRLAFDAAYCKHWQNAISSMSVLPPTYMLADSSPQFQRDWFIMEFTQPAVTLDGEVVFKLLLDLGKTIGSNEDATLDKRQKWTAALKDMIVRHVPIPTALGSGRTSIGHKLHNLLHALYMDCGSWGALRRFLESVVSFTTDQGVESHLAFAPSSVMEGSFVPRLGAWQDVHIFFGEGASQADGPDSGLFGGGFPTSGAIVFGGIKHVPSDAGGYAECCHAVGCLREIWACCPEPGCRVPLCNEHISSTACHEHSVTIDWRRCVCKHCKTQQSARDASNSAGLFFEVPPRPWATKPPHLVGKAAPPPPPPHRTSRPPRRRAPSAAAPPAPSAAAPPAALRLGQLGLGQLMPNCLWIPGALHILHGACGNLTKEPGPHARLPPPPPAPLDDCECYCYFYFYRGCRFLSSMLFIAGVVAVLIGVVVLLVIVLRMKQKQASLLDLT